MTFKSSIKRYSTSKELGCIRMVCNGSGRKLWSDRLGKEKLEMLWTCKENATRGNGKKRLLE